MAVRSADAGMAAPRQAPGWARWLWLAIAAAALWFAWRQLSNTDWGAVAGALREREAGVLVAVFALALASHGLYALLDVVGARTVGLPLRARRVWRIAAASYALNLNLGALVGGVASRYRLYLRQGASPGEVTRVIALSMAGNWIGYAALLALAFAWARDDVLSRWVGEGGALAIMLALGLAVLAWFAACARGATWRLRGREFDFPPLPGALLQAAIGAVNWLLMGAIMWLCLPDGVRYAEALGALLAAAIAGAATHVPGGWGVLDYVLVHTLESRAPRHELVAAVLVYRAAYYLLPLAIAIVNYVLLERRGPGSSRA